MDFLSAGILLTTDRIWWDFMLSGIFRAKLTSLGILKVTDFFNRWYLEPEHKLHGKAETRNNYYNGKLMAFNNSPILN